PRPGMRMEKSTARAGRPAHPLPWAPSGSSTRAPARRPASRRSRSPAATESAGPGCGVERRRIRDPRQPAPGLVCSRVAMRLAARAQGDAAERVAAFRALWHRLRSRRSLYHHLEPWLLLGLTQAFGVAFNLGALFGCLRLIVFSDIAFSWSTTLLQLDPAHFH